MCFVYYYINQIQSLKYFSKSFSVLGQMVLFFMQVWCATTALGYTTNTFEFF